MPSAHPANDHPAVSNTNQSRVQVFPFATQAAAHAADQIQAVIRRRAAEGRLALLAFDISSPSDIPDAVTLVLDELASRVNASTLSLANVAAIPVWDWWPSPSGVMSQSAHLRHFLQTRTDICGANIWSLEGGERESLPAFCSSIENRIAELGGIDLVLLRARQSGQLGQNEINGWSDSRTRLVFAADGSQPRRAITLGLTNLKEAAHRVLIGTGSDSVASVLWHSSDTISPILASATLISDRAAAGLLTHIGFPWQVGPLAQANRTWDDLTIAQAMVAGSGIQDQDCETCPELLATFAGVAPDQDPRPELREIAARAIRGSVNPRGWRRVLLVSRDADSPSTEFPGMLRSFTEQGVTIHTVCLRGDPEGSRRHTHCSADSLAAWISGISSAINTHKPDHIIAFDDVSGLLSQAALQASAGQPIQVLCAHDVQPWQFQWIWLGSSPARADSPIHINVEGRVYLANVLGTDRHLEILGLVR